MDEPGTGVEQAATPARRDWNAAAAVIAALIGLLALAVSGYTAVLQRQQVRAEVWPYLQTGISPTQLTMSLENKGVGPALIRGVEVFVDGRPQRNWPELFDALDLSDLRLTPASTINGVVLAPGDVIQQMSIKEPADFSRFYAQYPRIQLRICYCSALEECWLYDERIREPAGRRTALARCPAPGPDEFVDNVLAVGAVTDP